MAAAVAEFLCQQPQPLLPPTGPTPQPSKQGLATCLVLLRWQKTEKAPGHTLGRALLHVPPLDGHAGVMHTHLACQAVLVEPAFPAGCRSGTGSGHAPSSCMISGYVPRWFKFDPTGKTLGEECHA